MAKSEAKRATLPLGRINTDARFIHVLRDEGRHCVDARLDLNFRNIGTRSSLSLAEHPP
ncbi:MAG: hypothetical protein AB7E73_07095 [Burkholderiales bacterium]